MAYPRQNFDFLDSLYKLDMEDLKSFAKNQGAAESDSLTHWDTTFWSERLRESKYDINEVLCPSVAGDAIILFESRDPNLSFWSF